MHGRQRGQCEERTGARIGRTACEIRERQVIEGDDHIGMTGYQGPERVDVFGEERRNQGHSGAGGDVPNRRAPFIGQPARVPTRREYASGGNAIIGDQRGELAARIGPGRVDRPDEGEPIRIAARRGAGVAVVVPVGPDGLDDHSPIDARPGEITADLLDVDRPGRPPVATETSGLLRIAVGVGRHHM